MVTEAARPGKGTAYVQDRAVWVGDRRVSLVSGEVHYWRLDPGIWPRVLSAAQELGLRTVASYVQWHFHEVRPGEFDFVGATDRRRNLVAYLDLVRESGLDLIIRPGPYTFAEWDNYGVPDRVAGFHRLHPEFRAAAGRYLEAVCNVLRPYLVGQGGPIVLLQADNMFDLGQHRYDGQLGLWGGRGVFQEYLQTRYGSIEALNLAWGTTYTDFREVMATTVEPASRRARAAFMDFVRFRTWFARSAAEWTVGEYRRHGMDVPVYSNATEDQDPAEMMRTMDLLGVNHYPTRDYGMIPHEHQRLLEHVRAMASVSPVPYVAEMESGIWHGYHYTKGIPYPEHYRFALLTVLAGGAVGWNWYMLHDRDNWYMSVLNDKGRRRLEVWAVFSQFVELERRLEPFTWWPCAETGVTHDRPHLGRGARAAEYEDRGDVWRVLYEAGIDYRVWHLGARSAPPKVLFYGGGDLIDVEVEEALRRYVEGGGHLVVLQRAPVVWKDGRERNALGIPGPDGVDSQGYMNTFHKDYEVRIGGLTARVETPERVYVYGKVEGEPIAASRTLPRGALNDNVLEEYRFLVGLGGGDVPCVGFHQSRGRGSVTVLGTPASAELIATLHAFLGVPIPARPLTPGVHAILSRKGDERYLIVLNTGWEDKSATVLLDPSALPGGGYSGHDLLDDRVVPVGAHPDGGLAVSVSLRRRSGTLVALSRG
jgi:hypothetical protein